MLDIDVVFNKREKYPYIEITINNHQKPIRWFQIVSIISPYPLINEPSFANIRDRFIDKNSFIDAIIDPPTYFPFYGYGNKFIDYPIVKSSGYLK